MDYLADTLLAAGALGATLYCYILAKRLARFNDLERGVGGAVAMLSAQVNDLRTTLDRAQESADTSAKQLAELTTRAETAAKNLELMIASLHDMPAPDRVAHHSEDSDPLFFRHPAQERENA